MKEFIRMERSLIMFLESIQDKTKVEGYENIKITHNKNTIWIIDPKSLYLHAIFLKGIWDN